MISTSTKPFFMYSFEAGEGINDNRRHRNRHGLLDINPHRQGQSHHNNPAAEAEVATEQSGQDATSNIAENRCHVFPRVRICAASLISGRELTIASAKER